MRVCYVLYSLAFAFLIVVKSRYGFNGDDMWVWNHVILGKDLWHGTQYVVARFFPLAGFDMTFLSWISSNPYLFYSVNAFNFLLVSLLYYKISRLIRIPVWAILVSFFLTTISPGYVTIVMSLSVPERVSIPMLLIFVYCVWHFYRNANYLLLPVVLVACNVALYLKEVNFVFFISFVSLHTLSQLIESARTRAGLSPLSIAASPGSDSHLRSHGPHTGGRGGSSVAGLFCCRSFLSNFIASKRHVLICNALVAISCLVFICLYYVYTRDAQHSYNKGSVYNMIRNVSVFVIVSSFVSLSLTSLLVLRLYRIILCKDQLHVLLDPLMFAGFLYFLSFVVLGMSSLYYLVPAQLVSSFPMLYYLYNRRYVQVRIQRFVLYVCLFFSVTSTIPYGIHLFSFYKLQAINLDNAFRFLERRCRGVPSVTIFFDGLGIGSRYIDDWTYGSLFERMRIYGIDVVPKTYELNSAINMTNPNADLGHPQEAKSGDLIFYSVLSDKLTGRKEVANMLRDNDLLYESDFSVGLARYNLMSFGAYVLIYKFGMSPTIAGKRNLFKLPTGTYILAKR